MRDLGISKENYSCIILQDIFERLDSDTSLRYRSKIELKRELLLESSSGNANIIETDLDSLCKFIRSEATTLELSSANNSPPDHLKAVNVLQKAKYEKAPEPERRTPQNITPLCVLGYKVSHRLIDIHPLHT